MYKNCETFLIRNCQKNQLNELKSSEYGSAYKFPFIFNRYYKFNAYNILVLIEKTFHSLSPSPTCLLTPTLFSPFIYPSFSCMYKFPFSFNNYQKIQPNQKKLQLLICLYEYLETNGRILFEHQMWTLMILQFHKLNTELLITIINFTNMCILSVSYVCHTEHPHFSLPLVRMVYKPSNGYVGIWRNYLSDNLIRLQAEVQSVWITSL